MLVCVSSHNFAHETAGAARIRHSPRPLFLWRETKGKTRANRAAGSRRCVLSVVIARAGGRSSIPETAVIESRSRGVLDHPLSRVMTSFASLRGANGSRECAPDDRLRDEAIHTSLWRDGLLRFARNDGR